MRPTSCPGSIARCVSTTSNCWTTPKRSSAVLKERQRPAIERARTAAAQGSDCLNQLSSLIRPIRNGAPQRCESIRTHHLANRRSARTPFILLGSGPAFGEISPTLPQADFGPAWGHSQCREITPGKSRLRQQEYAPGFLPPRLLLDVVPNLGGSEVLAAEGVGVDLRGGGDRRVAEAFADGRAKTRGGFSGPNRRGKSRDSACMRHALAIRSFRRRMNDRLPCTERLVRPHRSLPGPARPPAADS